jgi:hypothetical protein
MCNSVDGCVFRVLATRTPPLRRLPVELFR